MQNQPVTETVLQEMTDLLVREAKPRKILLFGSYARGTARANSDLDFLVVKDGPFNAQRSRRAEMTRMRSILGDYFIPMDFLVFTPQEIEEWKDVRNHVVSHALREGRILYESN